MKKVLHVSVYLSLLLFLLLLYMIPVSAVGKDFMVTKLSISGKNMVWLQEKKGDLDHFFGAEMTGDSENPYHYYMIDWNGDAVSFPEIVEKVEEKKLIYSYTENTDATGITVKNSQEEELGFLTYEKLEQSGITNIAQMDISYLGILNKKAYYTVKDLVTNQTHFVYDQGSACFDQPISSEYTISTRIEAGQGFIQVVKEDATLLLNFEGKEILHVEKNQNVFVSPFGFIAVQYQNEVSGIATSFTKLLSYEGIEVVAEIPGQFVTYVTSNVLKENNQSDYLKIGRHLFAVIDPVSNIMNYYIIEIQQNLEITPSPDTMENKEEKKVNIGSFKAIFCLVIVVFFLLPFVFKKGKRTV